MEPAVVPGDFVVAIKLFQPKRGDVVLLPCPDNDTRTCIRRIVGLEGDRIEIVKQRLFLNDAQAEYDKSNVVAGSAILLERSFGRDWDIIIDPETPTDFAPTVVPPGHVFLLNDRRSDASDSRTWGVVSVTAIEARAWFIWLSIDWARNRVNWNRILQGVGPRTH